MSLRLDSPDPRTTKVQTRDGREAVILEVFEGRIFGRVSWQDIWHGTSWCMDGAVCSSLPKADGDLVNIPERRSVEVWISFYDGNLYASYRKIEHGSACLAQKKFTLEYEVGEGLEGGGS